MLIKCHVSTYSVGISICLSVASDLQFWSVDVGIVHELIQESQVAAHVELEGAGFYY